ncbi:Orn/Lys/Arg decarboxylase N-terminal domain-containing protein [Paludibacterium denitrificans]|uniref:Orn/Lys/Arg decarboxylase N-terminal domain-containing protein n=1 Tax=Paludibacterium denitrificans TaxID=2675226 RepID=UPI001E46F503|nr:Orn/Lys/Arg decarboxylase N-terminal domain-containing protein [Paludibacterium denitrificans]
MRFHFPIVIIDEDFRSENTSGSGIRELAEAIEAEGMGIIGYTSYGDLTSFAQQQSRAASLSCRLTTRNSRRKTRPKRRWAICTVLLRKFVAQPGYSGLSLWRNSHRTTYSE